AHPRGGSRCSQLAGAVVVVFLFAEFARGPDARLLLATESPSPVHAQVHVKHQLVVEIQKPVLTVGLGGHGPVRVELFSAVGKAAMRGCYLTLLGYGALMEVVRYA